MGYNHSVNFASLFVSKNHIYPMAERGQQSGSPIERRNLSSYKTIGVLVIGDRHYLYQEDPNGVPYAHAIDPNRDRLAFMQATRCLLYTSRCV